MSALGIVNRVGFTPGRINLNKYRRLYCEYQGGGQRPGSSCPRPPTPQFRNDWGLPLVPGRLPPLFQSHAALNSLPSRGPLVLVMQIFVTPVLLLHYPEITQVAKVWTRHAITLDPGGIQNASRNLKELASVRSCRVGEHLESCYTEEKSLPGCASSYNYHQSNNQLPGPKGRTAWAVPIITGRYALV